MISNKSQHSISFKAIGEDNRLNILTLLASGEKCVCKIYEKLCLPQNLVSHHLGILRNAGLIISRKDGKWVYYSLNKKKFTELSIFFSAILETKELKAHC